MRRRDGERFWTLADDIGTAIELAAYESLDAEGAARSRILVVLDLPRQALARLQEDA